MSTLSDYTVSANLITSELLICTLVNEDLTYESKITPECLKSGLLNPTKFQNIILKNAKEPQQFYTIRINKIDSYNIVLHLLYSSDLIEFEEHISFKRKNIADEIDQINELKKIIKKQNTKIDELNTKIEELSDYTPIVIGVKIYANDIRKLIKYSNNTLKYLNNYDIFHYFYRTRNLFSETPPPQQTTIFLKELLKLKLIKFDVFSLYLFCGMVEYQVTFEDININIINPMIECVNLYINTFKDFKDICPNIIPIIEYCNDNNIDVYYRGIKIYINNCKK
jgi:hypothetical protein